MQVNKFLTLLSMWEREGDAERRKVKAERNVFIASEVKKWV